MAKKHSSINDYAAGVMKLNQNALELLTRIDESLTSNDSYVSLKSTDANGKEVIVQLPTIGNFKQQLDQIKKMVRSMTSIEGNAATIQTANNVFKRIITADINTEPKQIPSLNPITIFKTNPNWIFDNFLNPLITVELDLTNKIDNSIKKIESKRFIVEFEYENSIDADGNVTQQLTVDGAKRKSEFDAKYKGKSDINMIEFVAWLDTPGLLNRINNNLIDQDYFNVTPNRLQYKGDFTITNSEIDFENNKAWYTLNSLTYYDVADQTVAPKPITLKIGDLVKVNPIDSSAKSSTVYKIVEISNITSEYRVRFEREFGEEPIQIRTSAISIYSSIVQSKTAKVSVGFDEHCVIFVRAVDEFNNLVGADWSPGVGLWTNELRLDNNSGEAFSDFYISKVYDYGLALEELVAKKIPVYYAEKVNAPALDTSTFNVVQTNQHLTQTVEAEQIRDLHNQKNNITSQITQLQTSIEKQNRLIATTRFNNIADKKAAQDQLSTLSTSLDTKNKSKYSIVQDIIASKKNLNKIIPEFAVRGFFPFPKASTQNKTKPQEVVQFEIWYRKLSKSGTENPILTIPNINNSAAQESSVNSGASTIKQKTVNGAFSNWTKYKTDARKQVQQTDGTWIWEVEDVSDANTPNINQVNIPIMPDERIEIKIKALSEAGFPDTPAESEFSNTIIIDFPEDLKSILTEDEFILKEAQADDQLVKMHADLDAKGLNLHLSTAIKDADIYFPHRLEDIASGIKDASGKMINGYEFIQSLISRINSLEEQIKNTKGILEIFINNAGNKTRIYSGDNLTFNVNLEDYMSKTMIGIDTNPVTSTNRTYKNTDILNIKDFSLIVKNAAETSLLGVLSYRSYGSPAGKQSSKFAYNPAGLTSGVIPQATWVKSDSTVWLETITENSAATYDTAPLYGTQKNNQWIWLQTHDAEGNSLYGTNSLNQNYWKYTTLNTMSSTTMYTDIVDPKKNVGLKSTSNIQETIASTETLVDEITDATNWIAYESYNATNAGAGKMGTTIHPVINTFTEITDISDQKVKKIGTGDTNAINLPINIYAKPYTGTKTKNTNNNAVITDTYITSFNISSTSNITSFGGKLYINLSTAQDLNILADDKIVMTGFSSTSDLAAANNKVLKVISFDGTNLNLDYPYNPTTSYSGTIPTFIQLHKKHQCMNGTANQLVNYNVYGSNKYVNNYVEIISDINTPKPVVHTKALRFYMEDENNVRPVEFQLTFNIMQYKKVLVSNTEIASNTINNFNNFNSQIF